MTDLPIDPVDYPGTPEYEEMIKLRKAWLRNQHELWDELEDDGDLMAYDSMDVI